MTAAAIGATSGARLDVGWVVALTAGVIARRFLDLLVLGLPTILAPAMVADFLPPDLGVLRLAAGLPALVFIGGASLMTFRQLADGARLGIGEAFSVGARRFGTLWGIGLISNLATAIGALLLLVPGIIVAVGWMPASTVAVAEGKTAFDALDRAWQLTRGSRWRLFGLVCIALGAGIALMLAVVIISAIATLAVGPQTARTFGYIAVAPLFAFGLQTLATVGCACAYAGLRRAKEGSLGDVAAVFV